MADQGRSDIDVVFTVIICATNFLFGKLWSSYSQNNWRQIASESMHT